MDDPWKDKLRAIDRVEPDQARLRDLSAGGPRMADPPHGRGRRAGALLVGLAAATASTVLVVSVFRGTPTPTDQASPTASEPAPGGIDPAAVCQVPPYDPDVALLVGNETFEYPRAVLEEPGSDAASLDGPAADALRSYLASPEAVNAPHDGWRAIAEASEAVTYAAPPDGGYSDWWVVRFEVRDGDWRATSTELVDQRPTPAQRGRDLRLVWTGEIALADGEWSSTLRLVSDRRGGSSDVPVEPWGLVRLFDADTDELVADGSGIFPPSGDGELPAGDGLDLPVALGGVATGLPSGTYEVVACVPQLALASPVGTLRVVDGPSEAEGRVLTYRFEGFTMEALGGGILTVHEGCLAVAQGPDDPNPTYAVWPEGYALLGRGDRTVLIDPVGREVSELGQEVLLVGGYVPRESVEEAVLGGVPESCRAEGEGYFITSGLA